MLDALNLYDGIPESPANEEFLPLTTHDGVRIERIVSKGHVTPEDEWHDQSWAEWVLVARGAAELTIAGPDEVVRLAEGDWLTSSRLIAATASRGRIPAARRCGWLCTGRASRRRSTRKCR